jgi:hypothetical protein
MKKRPTSAMLWFGEDQTKPKEVEMECITGEGQVFDVGSLYAEFCQLQDPPQGKRQAIPAGNHIDLAGCGEIMRGG